MPAREYRVPAVEKGLDVLEVLAESETPLTLSEITRRTGLPKATVFAILATLRRRHYVEPDPSGRWSIGITLFGLGSSVIRRFGLRTIAAPLMREFAKQYACTVHLGIFDRGEAVYLHKEEGSTFVRFATAVGDRIPIYCTGVGMAMLAYMPADLVLEALHSHPPMPRTDRTITDVPKLLARLDSFRQQGFALDDEDDEPGVRCLGVPIFNEEGEVCAAISVTGLVGQLNDGILPTLAKEARALADAVSAALGHSPT